MPTNHLANEWTLLQTQCDSYEKYALLIKLAAVAVVSIALLTHAAHPLAIIAIIGVLWMQEAIWKTFQSRLETRLLVIEKQLATRPNEAQDAAYQLNTEFLAQRRQGGVVREYAAQAVRPTIAFPYAVLMALAVVF